MKPYRPQYDEAEFNRLAKRIDAYYANQRRKSAMPSKPLHPCKHPGCPNLTREQYCEEHATDYIPRDRCRKNSRQRGYDRQWEKFREHYLRSHPLCVDCEKQGQYTPAKEVHHIKKLRDYPMLKYNEDNLMGLCHTCHCKRTARGE